MPFFKTFIGIIIESIVAILLSSDKENLQVLFWTLFSFQKWKNFPFYNGNLIIYILEQTNKYLIIRLLKEEPKAGLEPATYSLRMSYSTN